jgi:hypothetical protein
VLEHGTLFFTDMAQNLIDADGCAVLRYLAADGPGAVVTREALLTSFPSTLDQTLALLMRRESPG